MRHVPAAPSAATAGLAGGLDQAFAAPTAGIPGPGSIDWPSVKRPSRLSRIVDWSAAELSVAIRRRVVSCVEVMTAYLNHIDEINPKVNAIVNLRPRTDLLTEAAERDAQLRAGTYLGWMHGFPHAVKDLANVKGLKTTSGFFRPPFDIGPAAADALPVERIRAAGVIFIGTTNTPEFGLGSHTYNQVFGTTFNAYDQTRSAGGSSGGAAVAVALRMLPVADGSDFFGSCVTRPAGTTCTVCGPRSAASRATMPRPSSSRAGWRVRSTPTWTGRPASMESRCPPTLLKR